MGEVVSLGGEPIHGEPNGDLVQTLEGLLEDARSGKLRALAYCTVRNTDLIGTGWDGSSGTRYPLGSAILILQSRYANGLQGGDT
jgi:hypothetical protein